MIAMDGICLHDYVCMATCLNMHACKEVCAWRLGDDSELTDRVWEVVSFAYRHCMCVIGMCSACKSAEMSVSATDRVVGAVAYSHTCKHAGIAKCMHPSNAYRLTCGHTIRNCASCIIQHSQK